MIALLAQQVVGTRGFRLALRDMHSLLPLGHGTERGIPALAAAGIAADPAWWSILTSDYKVIRQPWYRGGVSPDMCARELLKVYAERLPIEQYL